MLMNGRFRYIERRVLQFSYLRFFNNAHYRKPKVCVGCLRRCTKMNYKGLSTLIEVGGRRVFLPGDAMYGAWPKEIEKIGQLHLLVVPHHGMALGNCHCPAKLVG